MNESVSSQSGGLSIIYYNARSLIPKIDELLGTAEAKHPDVICIVESYNEIQDNELNITSWLDYTWWRYFNLCTHFTCF